MKRAPHLLRAWPLLSLAGCLAACAPLPATTTADAPAGGPSAPGSAAPAGSVRTAAAAAEDGRPQRFTLANGMTLIVQPDRRAPTAVQMVWVRVGAYDESDGWTGVAHALEHMMFKGTPSLPPGEFSRRVAALGGRENAFTSQDYTGYYQQIPAGRLEDVMKIESDRFARNQWPDDEFKREIEVIKEERRMRTDDNPRSRLYEVLQATTFVAAPYRRPVIGWPGDLDTMTADDVRDFHRRWYQPANAAVVVAGDVDVAAVRRLAERYYGAIPAGALPARKPRTEPVQAGIRRAEVKAPAEQAYVALNFKVPRLSADTGLDRARATPADDDALALTVLSAVLDGYPGARLDRALTQGPDRVADSVNASHDLIGRGPSLFGLQGVPARGKTAAQVEAGLRAEVARVAREGVTAAELERVKTQWRAGEVYKRDSVFGLANELGSDWVQGLPLDASERLIARLQDITPARVQAVAAKYFGDDQLTVATLLPQPRAAGDTPVRPPATAAGGALR